MLAKGFDEEELNGMGVYETEWMLGRKDID